MLYTFYGDDFTGSTDVLEQLAANGVPTVLFLTEPTPEHLSRFPNAQAIGIAGDSRSRSPAWMAENLPRIFATLKSFNAPINHYKVCSTFDSSPTHGSIGRAIELGREVFAPVFIPIVVAAPHLGRYVRHGQLFAKAPDGHIKRIDQHPMANHPVTPMREPDLRKHLAAQTSLPIGLIDLASLQRPSQSRRPTGYESVALTSPAEADLRHQLSDGNQAILFDGEDDQTLATTGHLIWHYAQQQAIFAAASSGLTAALIPAWRKANLIPVTQSTGVQSHEEKDSQSHQEKDSQSHEEKDSQSHEEKDRHTHEKKSRHSERSEEPLYFARSRENASSNNYAKPAPASSQITPLLVLSGSCSPVTAGQIEWALANGFRGIAIHTQRFLNPATAAAEQASILTAATASLASGHSTILYTALGQSDTAAHGDHLGQTLGHLLRKLLHATTTRRVLLCGGDTSSHAIQQLGLYALTWVNQTQPGAPLCRAHSDDPTLNKFELVLKGGQVGTPDFFQTVHTAS